MRLCEKIAFDLADRFRGSFARYILARSKKVKLIISLFFVTDNLAFFLLSLTSFLAEFVSILAISFALIYAYISS